jgi:hypothetical protein
VERTTNLRPRSLNNGTYGESSTTESVVTVDGHSNITGDTLYTVTGLDSADNDLGSPVCTNSSAPRGIDRRSRRRALRRRPTRVMALNLPFARRTAGRLSHKLRRRWVAAEKFPGVRGSVGGAEHTVGNDFTTHTGRHPMCHWSA